MVIDLADTLRCPRAPSKLYPNESVFVSFAHSMTRDPQSEPLAGSAPAEQAQDALKQTRSPAATRHARERIVLSSMVLVTVAAAATLYVLYEFPLGSALLAAGGVWALLMTIHLQLRKDQEIARLRAEIHRLERHADNAEAAAAAIRQGTYTRANIQESAVAAAPATDPSVLEKAIKDTVAHTVAQQAPANRDGNAIAGGGADRPQRKQRPMSEMAEMADEVAAATAAMRLDPNPRWDRNKRPQRPIQQASQQASVLAEQATSTQSTQNQTKPQPVGPASEETALWPGTEVSSNDPMRDQWAFRPRSEVDDDEDAAGSKVPALSHTVFNEPKKPASIEADLAMVQRKIKALADEVNAADAARERERRIAAEAGAAEGSAAIAGKAAAEPQQRTSMIEKSIGALKSAANTMRTKSAPPDAVMGFGDDDGLDAQGAGPVRKSGGRSDPTSGRGPAGPQTRIEPQPAPAASAGDPLSFDLLIPKTAETIAATTPRSGGAKLPPLPDIPLPDMPMPALDLPETRGETRERQAARPPAASAPPLNPRLAAIAAALHDGEMDIFLSPIVALESHQVSHYDVTVRLKTHAGQYLDDAEQELRLEGSDLLALFDTARLRRSAALAGKLEAHNRKGSLLSDVNGYSMTNARFLETFARVYEERERISSQLVLTFSQADVEQFRSSAWQALDDMQAFGFRFALSKIDHADMDFATLAKRGFAFLRLDAGALLNGLPARDRFLGPDELCRHLAGAGMTLVADTIDDEAIRARVFGFGILFGQGRLFGGARQIKLDPLPPASSAAA